MTKEPDSKEMQQVIACPAKFANTMNCNAGDGLVRLTFGEDINGVKNFHTALVFKQDDLLKFATGIIQMLETAQ